jgi:tRNA pseudouridine55 synthase
MLNGILNVYKERGFTSNDVVAKLRGILHQKKIGHAGTLDPEATGVLPILLGSATRLSSLVMDHEKTYRAVLLLGVVTDTQDMTGTVLSRSDQELPGEAQIEDAVLSFEGGYDQLPPMYSAKQVNGKRLYELAREGKEIARSKVPVVITNLRITSIDLPEVTILVTCSKGTYIRTFCHDIGQKLGCGGTMQALERVSAGGFSIEHAIPLGRIEALASENRVQEFVTPCENLFSDCARVAAPSALVQKKLLNGNALTPEELAIPSGQDSERIRLCTMDGTFVAVYRFDSQRNLYRPYRMLL